MTVDRMSFAFERGCNELRSKSRELPLHKMLSQGHTPSSDDERPLCHGERFSSLDRNYAPMKQPYTTTFSMKAEMPASPRYSRVNVFELGT